MIIVISLYAGIVGACIGSFLDVLADRLPRDEDVFLGRSHCDQCQKKLSWRELIPLFSFLRQGGKCLHCHTKLSWEYPLVELTTACMFALLTWYLLVSNPLLWASSIIILSALLVIVVADLKYYIIPDSMVVIACLGAIASLLGQPFPVVMEHLVVGVCSFLSLYILWLITKRKGIGFGDVKLAFFVGFWVGFPQVVSALYLAFLTGAVVGIILMILQKKTLKSRVPFGPFLIFGVLASFFISLPKLIGL